MANYFVLNERGEPREETDFTAWSRWCEQADRSLARTVVTAEVAVVTLFRGVDRARDGQPPRLFETRVFGGVLDGEEVCQATRSASLEAHMSLVRWCRIGASPDCGVSERDMLR